MKNPEPPLLGGRKINQENQPMLAAEVMRHEVTIKELKTAKQDMKVLSTTIVAGLILSFTLLFLYVNKLNQYNQLLYTAHTFRHNMGVIAKNQEFIHGNSSVADMIYKNLPALEEEK